MNQCQVPEGGHKPVMAETFATAGIVVCEPAFNGSVMADIPSAEPATGRPDRAETSDYQHAIKELSE
jgi:hypothetical protein